MNWDKFLILGGQIAVLIVLGALVGMGHNDQVQAGLMAVAGSVAGVGVFQTLTRKRS